MNYLLPYSNQSFFWCLCNVSVCLANNSLHGNNHSPKGAVKGQVVDGVKKVAASSYYLKQLVYASGSKAGKLAPEGMTIEGVKIIKRSTYTNLKSRNKTTRAK